MWIAAVLVMSEAGLVTPRQAVSAVRLGDLAIGVTPGIIEMKLEPGKRRMAQVCFTNAGRCSVRGRARLMDLLLDEEGYPDFRDRGSQATSAGNWVRWEDAAAVLRPGERLSVELPIQAPLVASGSVYGAVVFDTEPVTDVADGVDLRVGAAALLFLSTGLPAVPSGKVKEVSLKDRRLGAIIQNTSKVHFRAKGSAVLWRSGRRLASIPMVSGTGTVLPGGCRRFEAAVPRFVGAGVIDVRLRFELGRGASASQDTLLELEERTPPIAATPEMPFCPSQ